MTKAEFKEIKSDIKDIWAAIEKTKDNSEETKIMLLDIKKDLAVAVQEMKSQNEKVDGIEKWKEENVEPEFKRINERIDMGKGALAVVGIFSLFVGIAVALKELFK